MLCVELRGFTKALAFLDSSDDGTVGLIPDAGMACVCIYFCVWVVL
jgi:hypothetical protein